MATVKKSKKKVIIPICIVLVIAIIVGVVFGVSAANSGEEVSLHTVTTGDIYETVSLTGEVTAGTTKEYKVSTAATVKEVFVNVGDKVQEGDVLATFDVTELDSQIASLQSDYNSALSSYNTAVSDQKSAQTKADSLESEISALEKKIAKLESQSGTTTATTTTKSTTTTTKATTTTAKATTTTTAKATTTTTTSGDTPTIGSLAEAIEQLNETLTEITDNLETLTTTTETIATVIAESAGKLDNQAIADAVVDALVESGMAESVAQQIVESIDIEAIVDSISSTDSAQLTAAQIQLVALEGQYALYSAEADDTLVSARKEALDATETALDVLKEQQEEMSEGWKAAFDGTITAVDITAGAQTTLLSSGITLENLDSMSVTVSLSEYDLHKVEVGMAATITTAYGSYDGEVTSIAPTATGGSTSSILDSVGSIAGISGLSSLTDSGAGVECIVSIPNADENITVGFDADVEIATGEYLGITVVPIESIVLEKTGSYVYLYNEEEKTVTKTLIETGAVSDSSYEVTSGLNDGDQIIAAPASDYEEDTFEVRVSK